MNITAVTFNEYGNACIHLSGFRDHSQYMAFVCKLQELLKGMNEETHDTPIGKSGVDELLGEKSDG